MVDRITIANLLLNVLVKVYENRPKLMKLWNLVAYFWDHNYVTWRVHGVAAVAVTKTIAATKMKEKRWEVERALAGVSIFVYD